MLGICGLPTLAFLPIIIRAIRAIRGSILPLETIELDRFAACDFAHPLLKAFRDFWPQHFSCAFENFPALFQREGFDFVQNLRDAHTTQNNPLSRGDKVRLWNRLFPLRLSPLSNSD